jgi:hypothetical protein
MKLLYDPATGKIKAIGNFFYKIESGSYWHLKADGSYDGEPIALELYEIDPISPENDFVAYDISLTFGKEDNNGNGKYYIDGDGDLAVVDGWEARSDSTGDDYL